MRHTHLALLTLATCLTLSAAGPKDVTYLEGDITGLSTNASGTLDLTNSKVMVLKSGDTKVEIPYLAVMKWTSKQQVVFSEKEPLYKVWTIKDRLMPPMPMQEVTVQYKGDNGAMSNAKLEMSKSQADKFAKRMARAEERRATLAGSWWGDEIWKTKRNEEQWGGADQYIASK